MADLTVNSTGDGRLRTADPFRWLRNEVDQLFEDLEPRPRHDLGNRRSQAMLAFPPVDMKDEGEKLIVTADVAGYGKDQIEVSLDDGSLVLKGARSSESERNEGGFLLNERREGAFERKIALPRRVDKASIRATLEKGTLRIELPKLPDPEARRIEIEQAG